MKLNQAQMSRLLPLQNKLQSAKGRYEADGINKEINQLMETFKQQNLEAEKKLQAAKARFLKRYNRNGAE